MSLRKQHPLESCTQPPIRLRRNSGLKRWRKISGIRCNEEEKVRFGIYMLQGNANNWWKSKLHTHGGNPTAYIWEMFSTAFYVKYFLKSKLRQLERQFLDLKKGSMSVEYEAEFDRLSCFAPKLNKDDESRAKRIEKLIAFVPN